MKNTEYIEKKMLLIVEFVESYIHEELEKVTGLKPKDMV